MSAALQRETDAVWERVSALVRGKVAEADPDRRRAARFLYSMLSWLELIGIAAARRGDNIPNQLEDETVHYHAFRKLAELNGGVVDLPAGHPGTELIEFITQLDGQLSLAVLNIVGEHWLATVFDHLRAGGVPYREVLDAVAEDEARHTYAALQAARPSPEAAGPVVALLEAHLGRFAASPEWLVPIHFLIGSRKAAQSALACLDSHRRACGHLGVEPGPSARDLEVASRATLLSGPDPEPAPVTAWQASRPGVWPDPAPLHEGRWLPVPVVDDAQVEALIARACAHALETRGGLNRTLRAGKVYRPRRAMIGVRRLYSRRREVFTVYATSPHLRSTRSVMREIAHQVERARQRPYEPTPNLFELEPLLPPPRAAIAISQNSPWGIREGYAALGPIEGCAATIVIGEVRRAPSSPEMLDWLLPRRAPDAPVPTHLVHLGCVFDHRIWDGPECGMFLSAIERWLEGMQ